MHFLTTDCVDVFSNCVSARFVASVPFNAVTLLVKSQEGHNYHAWLPQELSKLVCSELLSKPFPALS